MIRHITPSQRKRTVFFFPDTSAEEPISGGCQEKPKELRLVSARLAYGLRREV